MNGEETYKSNYEWNGIGARKELGKNLERTDLGTYGEGTEKQPGADWA